MNEGPTWAITFDGRKMAGLDEKGFSVIHYLVSHPRKAFLASEIHRVFNLNPADAAPGLSDKPSKDKGDNDQERGINADTIFDEKTLQNIRGRQRKLKKELRKAEVDDDLVLQRQISEELSQLESYVLGATWKGRSKRFRDEGDKIRDKYAKQIERALGKLKKYDMAAWKHFHDALRPVNNFCYNSSHEISWTL